MKALNLKAAHERLQISNPMFRGIEIGSKTKKIFFSFSFSFFFLLPYSGQFYSLFLYNSDSDNSTSQPRGQKPSGLTSEIIDRRLLFYFRVSSGQHHTKFRSISRGPQYRSTRDFNKFFFLFRSSTCLLRVEKRMIILAS